MKRTREISRAEQTLRKQLVVVRRIESALASLPDRDARVEVLGRISRELIEMRGLETESCSSPSNGSAAE